MLYALLVIHGLTHDIEYVYIYTYVYLFIYFYVYKLYAHINLCMRLIPMFNDNEAYHMNVYYKLLYYITIFMMFIYYILLLTIHENYSDYNTLYVIM